jgi:hypothetical protein
MKELSIEQKARRYDEAKYIMKEYLESGNAGVIAENTIKKAFPELAEDEDERIRKDIVTYLKSILSNKKYGDKFIESWISWLEKQGEKKHVAKYKVGDTIYYNSFGELKSMIVANVTTGGTDNPMYEDENGNAVFEKDLVEQKPAAWSEEDKEILDGIIEDIEVLKEEEGNKDVKAAYQREIDWLKSLSPQPHWKPSDEQMNDLKEAIEFLGCTKTLLSLYEQLLKLREE